MRFDTTSTILGALTNLAALQTWFANFSKKQRGPQRSLLLELHFNYRVLLDLFRDKESSTLDVIDSLQTKSFLRLAESDFDFNTLKRAKVVAATVGTTPYLQRFVGLTTEEVITNLYQKITILQHYNDLRTKKPHLVQKIRFSIRLQHIIEIFTLLLRHIKK